MRPSINYDNKLEKGQNTRKVIFWSRYLSKALRTRNHSSMLHKRQITLMPRAGEKKKSISLSRCSFRVQSPDWNQNLWPSVLRATSIVMKGSLNESKFYRLILIWELGQSSVQSCFSSLLHLKYDSLIANMCCVWVAGGNSSASEAQDKKNTAGLCIHLKKNALAVFTPLELLGSLYF